MTLAEILRDRIEQEAACYPFDKLVAASEELTRRYRERTSNPSPFMDGEIYRIAYLVARMPATFTTVKRVLEELPKRIPNLSVKSILDLGSGPGTVLWAVATLLADIENFTCLEVDQNLIQLGKKLLLSVEEPILKSATWQSGDLCTAEFAPHDLITISYAIGELSEESRKKLITKAWSHANKAMVIIEPGTKAGFAAILQARQNLINLGAVIAAPCPHNGTCPLSNEDWCHFSERVERSSLHRRMKGGTLGYEDEKYSYIIASKQSIEPCTQRVLRHPLKHSGHLQMVLCTNEGVEDKTISRRDGSLYKQARKAEWGDGITENPIY